MQRVNFLQIILKNPMTLLLIGFFAFMPSSFAQDKNAKKKEQVAKPAPSAGRPVQRHSVGIGLGQTFLLGDHSDRGDDKITLDLLYAYHASYSFDLLIAYHNHKHDNRDQEVRLHGLSTSIKARTFEFDNFAPYILGGLGFYRPVVESPGYESDGKIVLGVNAGAGADLRLNSHHTVGVLTQLHKHFNVDQDQGSSVRGAYFKLLMTYMYTF